MSGAPVSLPHLVAMRLRRTPIKMICQQRIKAHAADVDLSTAQLESAHLQGADVEKIVDTLLLARRTDRTVTWEQLVAAELEK